MSDKPLSTKTSILRKVKRLESLPKDEIKLIYDFKDNLCQLHEHRDTYICQIQVKWFDEKILYLQIPKDAMSQRNPLNEANINKIRDVILLTADDISDWLDSKYEEKYPLSDYNSMDPFRVAMVGWPLIAIAHISSEGKDLDRIIFSLINTIMKCFTTDLLSIQI